MSKLIDGQLFCAMVIEGALSIEEKKDEANELNVFPVPDGDTGTNMSLTMASAKNEMSKQLDKDIDLATASKMTASALLRGARGNSGVILSLLFRGMSKQLKTCKEANGQDLALALQEGVQAAYKAVMKPAEGTILTVSRVAAQHVVELCQSNPDAGCGDVLRAALEKGHEALAETTHQNPVLEKAGVVDAGGFGFLAVLEGMSDAYNGIHKQRKIEEPEPEAARPSAILRMKILPLPTAPSLSQSAATSRAMYSACARSSTALATVWLSWKMMTSSRCMCTPTSRTRHWKPD